MQTEIFTEIEFFRQRLNYLEMLNGWFFEAFESLVEMGDIYGTANEHRDLKKIFLKTKSYIEKFINFRAMGFYLVNEHDADLYQFLCEPASFNELIQDEFDYQINRGECAFALRQNRPIFPSKSKSGLPVMLHSMTTQRRVRGIFVGILENEVKPENHLSLYMSILIHLTSNAIEGVELYKFLEKNYEFLENLLENKTREMEHNAVYDKLTGLPNRTAFLAHLNRIFDYLYHKNSNPVIILNDVDNFKKINDTLGNEIGDITLQKIAAYFIEIITKFQKEYVVKTNISLYRFGGDEFIILFENISNIDYIADFVRLIQKSFSSKKFDILGQYYIFTLSAGISIYPSDGQNAELLLKRAEIAMYEVKKNSGNGFHFYQPGMDNIIAEHLEIESNLRIAIERQEFILYYQPKVNTFTNELVGFEALIRWNHPEKGLIMPLDFIPIAEKIGLISQLGEIVLKIACFDLYHWRKEGLDVVPVAVNISSDQFKKELPEKVMSLLQETRIPTNLIQIEITESTFLEDINQKIKIFEQIRDEGIKIYIDDFGTGFSSLSYLHKLPVSGLKIDRSFIKDLSFNPESKLITKSIIALAQSLDISVVAEGVETAEHLDILSNLGCDEIQGYLFSKPVHPDLVPDMLQKKILNPKGELLFKEKAHKLP